MKRTSSGNVNVQRSAKTKEVQETTNKDIYSHTEKEKPYSRGEK